MSRFNSLVGKYAELMESLDVRAINSINNHADIILNEKGEELTKLSVTAAILMAVGVAAAGASLAATEVTDALSTDADSTYVVACAMPNPTVGGQRALNKVIDSAIYTGDSKTATAMKAVDTGELGFVIGSTIYSATGIPATELPAKQMVTLYIEDDGEIRDTEYVEPGTTLWADYAKYSCQ